MTLAELVAVIEHDEEIAVEDVEHLFEGLYYAVKFGNLTPLLAAWGQLVKDAATIEQNAVATVVSDVAKVKDFLAGQPQYVQDPVPVLGEVTGLFYKGTYQALVDGLANGSIKLPPV